MIDSSQLQLVGTVAIGLFALVIYWVAFSNVRYNRFGREMLFLSASLIMSVVPVRFLVTLGVLSQSDARTINGILGLTFLVLIAQVLFLQRKVKQNGSTRRK